MLEFDLGKNGRPNGLRRIAGSRIKSEKSAMLNRVNMHQLNLTIGIN